MFLLGDILNNKLDLSFKTRTIINNISNFPWELITGFKNLKIWFKIIWNDRQWDHAWLYDIMLKKLELMEIYFKSNKTHCVEAERISKEIKTCKDALQRLNDDDYSTVEFKQYLNKISLYDIINNEKDDVTDSEMIDLHNKNRIYEQEQIELDMKIFFDMFSKSLNWWD